MKNKIKSILPKTVRQVITPRKIKSICLGTPKSGTTSIASLFSEHLRSDHEVDRAEFVQVIYRHYKIKMTDSEYVKYLKKRDKRLWLDIESNCFLGYRPDLIYQAYPDFKYV